MNRRNLTIAGGALVVLLLISLVAWMLIREPDDQRGHMEASPALPETGEEISGGTPAPDLLGPYTSIVIRIVATAALGGVVMVLAALGLGTALAVALLNAGPLSSSARRRRSYFSGRYGDLIQH